VKIIDIHEAKKHLSKLLERAAAGEEIVIGKSGKPVARLRPYSAPKPASKRKPGGWKGRVWISPDFDKIDPQIEKLFSGELE
jgi:prevent-host-death family protein